MCSAVVRSPATQEEFVARAPQTAALIPSRNLPKLVKEAVRLADERLGAPAAAGPIVRKWELVGRVVKDLQTADRFSAEVTQNLGPMARPALVKIDDKILAGFIEKIAIPEARF